jgi:hypothetical protein
LKPDVTPAPKKTASNKKLSLPKLSLPKLALPKLSLPKLSLPKLALPKLALPKLALPKLALPKLALPKKLMIPVVAAAVLLIGGGVAFGLLHARTKSALPPHGTAAGASTAGAAGASTAGKPGASKEVATGNSPPDATGSSTAGGTGSSPACRGVVNDLFRQARDDDPSVTLAEVRAEVSSSGVSCTPDPEVVAALKDLSPECRDMVQYTFLGVRDGHADITVNDVRVKVVPKSVACEHDRVPNVAQLPGHKEK